MSNLDGGSLYFSMTGNLGVVKWGQDDENCDCEELKNLFWKVFQVVAYCLPQFQVLRWHSRDGVDNHLIQDTMIHSLEIFLQAGWCLQSKTHTLSND